MKTLSGFLANLVLLLTTLVAGDIYAASLQKVDAVNHGNNSTQLRFFFDSAVGTPSTFSLASPNMVVIDFARAESAMRVRKKIIQSPFVKSVRLARGPGKLRAMVALHRPVDHQARSNGSQVIVTIRPESANRAAQLNQRGPAIRQRAVSHRAMASASRGAGAGGRLAPIDFRRNPKGGGTAIIRLPHPNTPVTVNKSGNTLVLTVKNSAHSQPGMRLNVMDFATPISYVDTQRSGADAVIKMIGNTAFTHSVTQQGSQYMVHMNRVARQQKQATDPLKRKQKKYSGKPLSLNFQDIEVRSVLQLLADFTDKNIVVSDSVTGNITLRLKSVPWDQALDIVLESKGLGMRQNGNVIWVAPAAELQAKEQQELQALQRKKALEPLVTEYISVNFAKAQEMLELINTQQGGKGNSMLSDRGSASVDNRTNTILLHDTVSRVDQIRAMVKSLDVPVKQVSVEARIVIANDTFGKELGTRFGVTKLSPFGSTGSAATSGSLESTSSMLNDITTNSSTGVAVPGLNDRLNVNLPVVGATGAFGFSILTKDYLLDLELSALQAESKGEIVSTPRVVTADKKKAIIEQGVEVPYLQASSSGATSVSFKKAVLSLEVTPQVTPDEHVIMDLKVNQDTVGAVFSGVPSINTREVNTQVLVDNGQTVVLGGVHEETNQHDRSKVPFLSDLPYLGKLFEKNVNSNNKRELLIFVTPKILQ